MTALRKAVIDSIYQALDDSYFGGSNYEVIFPDSPPLLVQITFLADRSFHFRIYDDAMSPGKIKTAESPGEIKISDERRDLLMKTAIERIDKWSLRIRQDLSSQGIKIKNPDDDILSQIDEYVRSLESPGEGFESSEVEGLKAQLSELQDKFEDLLRRSVINENELRNIKQQINGAKEDLSKFTKEAWYKTSFRKVASASMKILKTKETREIIAAAVKKLLENL